MRMRDAYHRPLLFLIQQLAQLHNDLNALLCTYQFYREAFQAMTAVEEPDFSPQRQYGLFLIGDWLSDTGETLLHQAELIHEEAAKQKAFAV